jgi:hypothetical protein
MGTAAWANILGAYLPDNNFATSTAPQGGRTDILNLFSFNCTISDMATVNGIVLSFSRKADLNLGKSHFVVVNFSSLLREQCEHHDKWRKFREYRQQLFVN